MADINEEALLSPADIMPGLRKLLPGASAYMLELVSSSGADISAEAVEALKQKLGIKDEPLGDLLASVLLLRQSAKAAKYKVEAYKKTAGNIAEPIQNENSVFIEALFKDKKIPPSIAADLLATYAQKGAADFKQAFEALLKDLNQITAREAQNIILACKVLLHIITLEEAAFAAQTAKEIKYPLADDDLQTIALRYHGQKTPAETAEVFETILKRLPYLDDPLENLGLAARVMADSRPQTMRDAQLIAAQRKGKVLFMRAVAADKYFAGYEDELTNKFFGQNSVEEVSSMFHHILKELPHGKQATENADIAVKVLLKKLPLQDAVNQAQFKKDNTKAATSTALEREAFESYLGTQNQGEVLAFFRQTLAGFTFWQNDEERHCYALSQLVARLNGKTPPAMADLALFLLEAGCPEESIDILTAGLASARETPKQAVKEAYDKFYAISRDHADAARRAVNMLQ